ncbi:type VI secretion system baseplate subunit TssK [Serratia ureilytica]
MPAAPRQIPYHAGYTYFELEKAATCGNRWKNPAPSLCTWRANSGLDMEFGRFAAIRTGNL